MAPGPATKSTTAGGRDRPHRLLLIGCGAFARQAHLPAIAGAAGDAQLVAVVDRAGLERDVHAACTRAGCAEKPIFIARPESDDIACSGEDFQASAARLPEVDAVVISSPEATHAMYLRWALARQLPILVDKPLTVRTLRNGRLSNPSELVDDWRSCCRRARSDVPFMLAAQRRYQGIYRRIAALVHHDYLRYGYAPTFVQCLTNDGLWHAPEDYARQPTYRDGAGKLVHTGYHVLDIVPWLLRHAQGRERPGSAIARVRTATVFAGAFLPDDAAAAWTPPRGGAAAETICPETLGEVNAALFVSLQDDDGRTVCMIQIGTLHEGLSLNPRLPSESLEERRAQAERGRNKQEILNLYMGPTAAIWMRRFAKLTRTDGNELGGNGHLELIHGRNPGADGGPALLQRRTLTYRADDDAPTQEFLHALGRPDTPVASPVHDHGVAVRLLAAAYESIERGGCVRVEFGNGEWALPPQPSLELALDLHDDDDGSGDERDDDERLATGTAMMDGPGREHDDSQKPEPSAVLVGIASSVRLERALWVAARLGVADHVPVDDAAVAAENAPVAVDVATVAEEVGADAGALYRVLRALASVGIFAEEGSGRFHHTPHSMPLRRDAPDSVRDVVLQYGDEPERLAWGEILHTVRTGEPAFEHVWGEPPWRYYEETRDRMTQISLRDARALAHHELFRGARHIVDVGGGEGSFLAAILAANPASRGTLLDRPEIVTTAPALLERAGVADRCSVIGGDMFQDVPGGGDLYLLKRTLHDWNDDDALALLRVVRDAMGEGGRLVILTEVVPTGNVPSSAKLSDLALMVMLGGRHRTERELAGLVEAAGLAVGDIVALPSTLTALAVTAYQTMP